MHALHPTVAGNINICLFKEKTNNEVFGKTLGEPIE